MNFMTFSPDQSISPGMLGLEVRRDENGHWSVYRDGERIGGPFFNCPAFTKRESKGDAFRTTMVVNPTSDCPQFFFF